MSTFLSINNDDRSKRATPKELHFIAIDKKRIEKGKSLKLSYFREKFEKNLVLLSVFGLGWIEFMLKILILLALVFKK